MKLLNLNEIKKIYTDNNYIFYDEPNAVNILAVRHNNQFTNKFDDLLIWIVNDKVNYTRCTTDAGSYYVKNPVNPKGTGVLAEGQYVNSHILGLHKSLYTALVQAKPLTVYRDNNKNDIIDTFFKEDGMYGINIHRANPKMESFLVDKWSAACIVISNPYKYNLFIQDCKNQVIKNKKAYFTLTLINESKINI